MEKAGIYLHIPFCKSRCSYCDFATEVYRSEDAVERYVNAIVKEISSFGVQSSEFGRVQGSGFRVQSLFGQSKSKLDDERTFSNSKLQTLNSEPAFDTIYFGGGTPSLLSASQVEKILDAVYKNFSIDEDSEITLEMNPATVSLETLKDYRRLGINRASFGVQTFNDRSLKILARGHDAKDARQTFELLKKAGFENVSFDLIGGLPNQTVKDWEKNLDEALKLNPEHISLYLLEVNEGTPLAEQIRSKRQPMPDEDLAGNMYELMVEKLLAKSFEQYEVSSFAKPGFRSRHNTKYWKFVPYYSFGVSAHSFDGKRMRWSNERDTARYVSLIENDKSPVVEKIEMDEKALRAEYAFLHLRLTEGINLENFKKQFGVDLLKEYKSELENSFNEKLIETDGKHLRLTRKGMLFSNEVFKTFL